MNYSWGKLRWLAISTGDRKGVQSWRIVARLVIAARSCRAAAWCCFESIPDRLAVVQHAGRIVLPGDAGGGVERGRPEVFNTDQGMQFTASAWTGRLESAGVAVSMDGKGRCLDNVFVERRWRTVKYEEVYLHRYEAVPQVASGLERYFVYYNEGWPHQSLDYRTPAAFYAEGRRDEEAFFFAPHDLSRGEGRAGRKRMPGAQAEDEKHEMG